MSGTTDLAGLVSKLLEEWRKKIADIPGNFIVQVPVEHWSDSWAWAAVPGGDGVAAKAGWLFTTRAGVPSNVVDVHDQDIDLRLPPLLPRLPLPRVVVLFDQRELGVASGAQDCKHPDRTPMVSVIVGIDPSAASGLDPVNALLGAGQAALAGLGSWLSPHLAPHLLLQFAIVGSAVNLDSAEFDVGGLFGIGRITGEDIARSAFVTGLPGSVVQLHNAPDGSNGQGSLVCTVPASGFLSIPAIFRQNGTALPVSDPVNSVTLLDGVEPPWPWTTFRDNISSVTFK
jgi:hypothetical protein